MRKSYAVRKVLNETGTNQQEQLKRTPEEARKLIEEFEKRDWRVSFRKYINNHCTIEIPVYDKFKKTEVEYTIEGFNYQEMMEAFNKFLNQYNPRILNGDYIYYKIEDGHTISMYQYNTRELLVCKSNLSETYINALKKNTKHVYPYFELLLNAILVREFEFDEDEIAEFSSVILNA